MSQLSEVTGSYGNAYSLVTTSVGNYMLMYDGAVYPSKIQTAELKNLNQTYNDIFNKLYRETPMANQNDIERTFLKFIKENLNRPGLQIYKVTQNSATKMEYNKSSPNNIKTTPCQ